MHVVKPATPKKQTKKQPIRWFNSLSPPTQTPQKGLPLALHIGVAREEIQEDSGVEVGVVAARGAAGAVGGAIFVETSTIGKTGVPTRPVHAMLILSGWVPAWQQASLEAEVVLQGADMVARPGGGIKTTPIKHPTPTWHHRASIH